MRRWAFGRGATNLVVRRKANMVYTGESISALFHDHLREARAALGALAWVDPDATSFAGFNGWVFEQTVRAALVDELHVRGITRIFKTQVSIGGRAKADLAVGDDVALELKSHGLFGQSGAARYANYARQAKALGFRYAFVTLTEGYPPYRAAIVESLGADNVFFLDQKNEWERLVDLVASPAAGRTESDT
jgi:hypothetical protein